MQPSRKKSKKQKKKHKQQQAQMAATGLGVSSDSEPEAASAHGNTADSTGGATDDGPPQADLDSEDDVLERMMQAAHIHQGAASHEVTIAAPMSMCRYANVHCKQALGRIQCLSSCFAYCSVSHRPNRPAGHKH